MLAQHQVHVVQRLRRVNVLKECVVKAGILWPFGFVMLVAIKGEQALIVILVQRRRVAVHGRVFVICVVRIALVLVNLISRGSRLLQRCIQIQVAHLLDRLELFGEQIGQQRGWNERDLLGLINKGTAVFYLKFCILIA